MLTITLRITDAAAEALLASLVAAMDAPCTAVLRDSHHGRPFGEAKSCGMKRGDIMHTEHARCPSWGIPADHPPVLACHEHTTEPPMDPAFGPAFDEVYRR